MANTIICGTPVTGNPLEAKGGSKECNLSATPASSHTVLPVVDICLGTSNCQRIEATVRIETNPLFAGPLTAKLVACDGNPGVELVPRCKDPLKNDVNHSGMLAFKWDLPNGNAGPVTTVSYEVLTSTNHLSWPCPTPLNDASHLRITDEFGQKLFILMRVSGSSC